MSTATPTKAAPAKATAKSTPKKATTPKPAPKAKAAPAKKPEPKPVPLKSVQKTETVRVFLKGRKGAWVAEGLRHLEENDEFELKVRWHRGTCTIPASEVTRMEVKRDKVYVSVML